MLRRLIRSPRWLLGTALALLLGLFGSHWLVKRAGRNQLYDKASDLPEKRVLVVLGCSKLIQNAWTNWFFTYRIRAAVQAWQAGKAKAIIVSGDNHSKGYDEPSDMKASLIEAGVPEEVIYCDYAGLRTLDSIVRAKRIFSQDKITIVSQRFHNERALFLAQQHGIDAIGLNAQDVPVSNALQTYLREILARVSAVLDCWVLGTQPKFAGPPVEILQS
jgi:SanA protein